MAIDKDMLDQLLADRDPKDLFAKDGLLDELKKALSERMLSAELDDHLENGGAEGAINRHLMVLHFDGHGFRPFVVRPVSFELILKAGDHRFVWDGTARASIGCAGAAGVPTRASAWNGMMPNSRQAAITLRIAAQPLEQTSDQHAISALLGTDRG